MGWEAAGSDEKVSEAMAMADMDPNMLRRDMAAQKEVMLDIAKKKQAARASRAKEATTLDEVQAKLNERGYVHGDQFMVIDSTGRIFPAKLDLRPLPISGPIPRFLEVDVPLKVQEEMIDKAKRAVDIASSTDSEAA